MANRLARGVRSELFEPASKGQVSVDLPNIPVGDGGAAAAAVSLFGGLSKQLGELADRAAKREGEAEGFAAGEGATPPTPAADVDPAPAEKPVASGGHSRAVAASDRAREAHAYYVKLGYTPAQAAGIVGNLMQESKLRTDLVGDKGTAFGVAQWRGERYARLQAFARSRGKPTGDYETQLAFVDHELRNHETSAFRRLKAATDVDTATAAMIGYERPRDWTEANPRAGHGWSNRLAYAMGVAGQGGGAVSMPSAPAAAEPPPPPRPLALRNDGTIRGEARDAAAMRSYASKLETGVTSAIDAAYLEHKDDPATLRARLAEVRAQFEGDATFDDSPELKAAFNRQFERKASARVLDAEARLDQRVHAEAQSDAVAGLTSQRQDLERRAYLLGANPAGDKDLEAELARLEASADHASSDGFITPAQREAFRNDARETIIGSKVRGTFDALATPEAKEKFADGLMASWAKGEGAIAKLDRQTVATLSSQLSAAARRDASDERGAAAVERAQMERRVQDDVASIASTGEPLALDGGELTENEVAARLGPAKAADWLERRNKARIAHAELSALAGLPPADLSARLKALEPKPGSEGFKAAEALHAAATKHAAQILALRRDDPAAAVDAAFPRVLRPLAERLDMNAPETLRDLADARFAAQEAIGIPPDERRGVTASEARSIGKAMDQSPDHAVAWATSISTMFGADAPRILAAISEDAPGLALAADFARQGGDPVALRRLAAQRMAEREPGWKAPSRSHAEEQKLTSAGLGPALSALPRVESAVRENAWRMFQSLARERGVAPDLKEPAAQDLYGSALLAATGGKIANGRQFGGVTEVNGVPTLAPVGMEAEAVERTLHALTDEDLAALPPIRSANGVPVRAKDLRDAHLVAVGDGLYRVAAGDPRSDDPRFAVGERGFWTLDIRKLAETVAARPKPGFEIPVMQ